MFIPLAPSPPDPHASGRTGSSSRSIHIASLTPMVHLPLFCHARFGSLSLSVGSRPSCFGSDCLRFSLRSHRNAPRDYNRRYCRVCSVHSTACRPSCFRSDKRLRSLHKHRIALLAFIPQIRCMSHSCFVSTITWFAPFTPDTLSVFIPRSLSRYARSCFAHQLLRSLNSHSSAVQWQMLRSVRQVKFEVAKS
jgi:hypothetical protein